MQLSARHCLYGMVLFCASVSAVKAAELNVWAAPEGHKIDKFGKKVFVQDPKVNLTEIKKKNGIWDDETKSISLAGARGEVLAFQLGIEGGAQGLKDVDVKKGALNGKTIPSTQIEVYKIYYTQVTDRGSGPTNAPSMGQGWYPDALVPWSVGDTTTRVQSSPLARNNPVCLIKRNI